MLSAADQVQLLEEDKKYGKRAIGRREYRKFIQGYHLSFKSRILAYCYTCMGCYADGSCDCEILTCPLHPSMPFRNIHDPGALAGDNGDQDGSKTDTTTIQPTNSSVDGRFKARKTARLGTTTRTTQRVISRG